MGCILWGFWWKLTAPYCSCQPSNLISPHFSMGLLDCNWNYVPLGLILKAQNANQNPINFETIHLKLNLFQTNSICPDKLVSSNMGNCITRMTGFEIHWSLMAEVMWILEQAIAFTDAEIYEMCSYQAPFNSHSHSLNLILPTNLKFCFAHLISHLHTYEDMSWCQGKKIWYSLTVQSMYILLVTTALGLWFTSYLSHSITWLINDITISISWAPFLYKSPSFKVTQIPF